MNQYTAFLLTDECKRRLMARFPPAYPHIKADHITHRFGAEDFDDLFWADKIEVIGVVDDNHGLQALLVRIDGETERPDGGTYHITWSLDPNRLLPPYLQSDDEWAAPYEAKHSNLILDYMQKHQDGRVSCRWLDEPFVINAAPGHISEKGPDERVLNILPKKPGSGYNPPDMPQRHSL